MRLYSEMVYYNAASHVTLQEKGVQFKMFPDDVIREFLKISLEVLHDTGLVGFIIIWVAVIIYLYDLINDKEKKIV